ncbi:uncharacterized protein IL334_000958 [Kwoniella shivajii]|uniref:Uncharacterized protein n=1 Tax=Kwoniella shivajii TaxID=564305 RepID=A0ABZ1CQM0_9TREE|nr:hypothetical protein IL334_000958 [Kwoniella shivajii]
MTQIPAGAQLSPVDLPPPPPGADPREPTAALTPRQRGSRTPQRPRSPLASRDTSPVRPLGNRSHSSELGASPPPHPGLHQPIPRPSSSSIPIHPHPHHLSRPPSPSSIHSSGSAIFERDIEFPPVSSLTLNSNNPNANQPHTLNHKTSRLSHLSHGSALDHTVPAVLDDAVEALTAGGDGLSRGFEGLEIESPVPANNTNALGMGMARQSSSSLPGRRISSTAGIPHQGHVHSRSPSPISIASRNSSAIASPATSPPILGQLNTQHSFPVRISEGQVSPTAGQDGSGGLPQGLTGTVPRPAMPQRMSTGPQVPGGWAFGNPNPSASVPTSLPTQVEPTQAPPAQYVADEGIPSPTAESPNDLARTLTPSSIPSHVSPNKNKHRISYLSYNDLLLSVPTKVTSLEDITSGNLSPDHLPGTVSPSMSTRSPVIPPLNPGDSSSSIIGVGNLSPSITPGNNNVGGGLAQAGGKSIQPRASFDSQSPVRLGGLGLGEGEWEREGLGKGLEQRLEEVAQGENQGQN